MKICWPNPDATCLEGGCIHCDGHPDRPEEQVAAWAATAGQVLNRYGGKTKDALVALNYRVYGK